jgi:hypothetical protein
LLGGARGSFRVLTSSGPCLQLYTRSRINYCPRKPTNICVKLIEEDVQALYTSTNISRDRSTKRVPVHVIFFRSLRASPQIGNDTTNRLRPAVLSGILQFYLLIAIAGVHNYPIDLLATRKKNKRRSAIATSYSDRSVDFSKTSRTCMHLHALHSIVHTQVNTACLIRSTTTQRASLLNVSFLIPTDE